MVSDFHSDLCEHFPHGHCREDAFEWRRFSAQGGMSFPTPRALARCLPAQVRASRQQNWPAGSLHTGCRAPALCPGHRPIFKSLRGTAFYLAIDFSRLHLHCVTVQKKKKWVNARKKNLTTFLMKAPCHRFFEIFFVSNPRYKHQNRNTEVWQL